MLYLKCVVLRPQECAPLHSTVVMIVIQVQPLNVLKMIQKKKKTQVVQSIIDFIAPQKGLHALGRVVKKIK